MNILHTGPLGVNTFVVPLKDNKVFIVDPATCSFCRDENLIIDFLCSKNLIPVAFVLTHGHFDHVAGLSILKEKYPLVPVLIHKNDAVMLGLNNSVQKEQLEYMGFSEFFDAVKNLPVCDSFLEDGKNLFDSLKNTACFSDLANIIKPVEKKLCEWKIIHTPGHTFGSVCLYNANEKILLSGDTLFYGSWGRTDLGGSESLIQKSLVLLKENIPGDVQVFPGHDFAGFKMSENF